MHRHVYNKQKQILEKFKTYVKHGGGSFTDYKTSAISGFM